MNADRRVFLRPLEIWLATKLDLKPALVTLTDIIASEGYTYSSWTQEDWSCQLYYRVSGINEHEHMYDMSESEMVEFLNDLGKLIKEESVAANRPD